MCGVFLRIWEGLMNIYSAHNPSIALMMHISKGPLLGLVFILPIWYALPSALDPTAGSLWVYFANATGPLLQGFMCALIAYRTVKVWRYSILTPYVGFFLQCVIYLSIGPLVFIFGGESISQETDVGVFRFDAYELLRTNLLNAVGICGFVMGVGIYALGEEKQGFALKTAVHGISPVLLMKVFLIFGGIINFGISLPQAFGQSTFQVPAMITALSSLFIGGLGILGYLYAKQPARWRVLFWGLLIPNTIISVLSFYKTEMVLSLLFPALGIFLAKPNLRRLAIWVTVISILFTIMLPLVSYGRAVIVKESGFFQSASLGRRFEILTDFVAGDEGATGTNSASQSAWKRLAYSGPQAFLMRLGDRGQEAVTLDGAILRLAPRFLFPDKPNYQTYGNVVYQMATNNNLETNVGGTVFADAYWHGGWLGTLICGMVVGIIFCYFTKRALGWLQSANFLYLPLVFFLWENSLHGVGKYMHNGLIVPVIYFFLGLGALNLIMALYRTRGPLRAR